STITQSGTLSVTGPTSLSLDLDVDPTAFGASGSSLTITTTPSVAGGGSAISSDAFPFVVYLQNPVLTSISKIDWQPYDQAAVDLGGTGLFPGPSLVIKNGVNLDDKITVSDLAGSS